MTAVHLGQFFDKSHATRCLSKLIIANDVNINSDLKEILGRSRGNLEEISRKSKIQRSASENTAATPVPKHL
jgi:VIT1/CCC1 family predicted Fe2+/Mn2+ transporter